MNDKETLWAGMSRPGTTAIIVTSVLPIRFFALSLLSLLQNSPISNLLVYLNGDHRDTGICDEKFALLNRLRASYPVNVSVIRVWGHVGHSHAIDSAIPWVHTENILCMHDDVLIYSDGWYDDVVNRLKDSQVGLVIHEPAYMPLVKGIVHKSGYVTDQYNGKPYNIHAHINSAFMVWRKGRLLKHGFTAFHSEYPDRVETYDIGGKMLEDMEERIETVNGFAFHFGAGSWREKDAESEYTKTYETLKAKVADVEDSLRPQLFGLYEPYSSGPLWVKP